MAKRSVPARAERETVIDLRPAAPAADEADELTYLLADLLEYAWRRTGWPVSWQIENAERRLAGTEARLRAISE